MELDESELSTEHISDAVNHVDMISFENENSDDVVSDDEESEDSDFVADIDYEESDFEHDDLLYAENIDKDVEWVGLSQHRFDVVNSNAVQCENQSKVTTNPERKKKTKFTDFVVYKGNAEDPKFEFEVGMQFRNADHFREAVRIYANKQAMPIIFKKNNSDKIKVICEDDEWVMYASFVSKIDKTFMVKTLEGEHTCMRGSVNRHCTAKFLATKYLHHLRSNPEWPVLAMQDIMQMENGTLLSVQKMYRVKGKCSRINNGLEVEQYEKLWDYCDEIRRTNPGTTVKIKCKHVLGTDLCMFKKFYLCWGAIKRGFLEGCRPLIGLDGTHLKTERKGVLLTAVGIDGNNNMYPIAYAVVKKEDYKTWSWFVELLMSDLNIENSYHWTIISDKQKGLIKAVDELLPNAEHRFCLRHMYNNLQKKHKGLELKELVWEAACATRVVDFDKAMETVKNKEPLAYEWLRERPARNIL